MGWVIALFAGGLALIVAEFVLPGGLCGAIGAAMIVASTIVGCIMYPDYAVFIVLAEVIGALVGIVLGLVLMQRTGAGKLLTLEGGQNADDGWVASTSDETLIGQEGEAYTKLRPAGAITIMGRRVGAVADGSYIARGAKVRVTEVHGNRVVVEEITE